MKVTRKQNGFTIRLNDGEYAMLDKLLGTIPPDVARRSLTDHARSAHTKRLKATNGDLLRIDVDKRAPA